MKTVRLPPFSARNRRDKDWIEGDFPDSARTGLLHLLCDAVDHGHISSWSDVAKELRRIARLAPVDFDRKSVESISRARLDAQTTLNQLDWERVYDFCERLYSRLAHETSVWRNDEEIKITKEQSQLFLGDEVQRIFEEESLGFVFTDGSVQRRGKRHTIGETNKAEKALDEHKLAAARTHFSKALRYFHDRKKPDHENTVKEAVCAVEAAAKELFPDAKASTLEGFVKWATDPKRNLIPRTLGNTFIGLYAFRGSGEGVSHGATLGGAVTAELSEYALAMAASQILLLTSLEIEEEPPF